MANLFKSPKMPKPEKPIPMPDMEQVERSTRRNASQRKNTGRTSTILTDALGG